MERQFDEKVAKKKVDASVDENLVFDRVEKEVGKKYKGYGAILEVIPEANVSGNQNRSYFTQSCLIILNILKSDCLLSIAVIFFGLIATFTSTYFNVFDGLDNFDQIWSPCILNISEALTNLTT